MVRCNGHYLFLLLCLDAVLAIPILSDAADDKGHGWPLMIASPYMATKPNISLAEAPWFRMLLENRPNAPLTKPSQHVRWLGEELSQALDNTSEDTAWPKFMQGLENHPYLPRFFHAPMEGHRQGSKGPAGRSSKPRKMLQAVKRSESGKIPTMGLGVLSDLRKFFNELRTNLDSVEEVAALSHERGIKPQDFLALLAQHEARLESSEEGGYMPPLQPQYNKLLFGYTPDDQPYAHSGLGK